MFNNRLTFRRGSVRSRLHATRMAPIDPTPTGLTAVATMSRVPTSSLGKPGHPSVPGASLAPLSPPPPLFHVIRAGPSAFDSHPLSHHDVQGAIVTADDGFPPAFNGVVPQDSSFQPVDSGVSACEFIFPTPGST